MLCGAQLSLSNEAIWEHWWRVEKAGGNPVTSSVVLQTRLASEPVPSHSSSDASVCEDAGPRYYAFRLCSSTAQRSAFVMQMAGTKCPFDNVQSGDKKAFTETVKLIHKAGRQ